jgi:hypothetical protein
MTHATISRAFSQATALSSKSGFPKNHSHKASAQGSVFLYPVRLRRQTSALQQQARFTGKDAPA